MASPPTTPMPTRPAASAAVASGGRAKRRGSTIQASTRPRRCGSGSARIASSRRPRTPGSSVTGRRASATISLRFWSSMSGSSVILDALPSSSQSVTRALHSHFQRRHANTRLGRHFLVTHLFDVLQQECFAEQGIQLGKHALHELLIFSRPCRTAVRRIHQQRFFPNEDPLALTSPRRNASTLVYKDPVQPRTELVPLLILPERSVRAEKGGLQCVLRVVAVAQHSHCKTRAAFVVAINQA